MGPIEVPMFDQPVYTLQKKVGYYLLDVIIMSSVVHAVLNFSKNQSDIITLYDVNHKKMIIKLGDTKKSSASYTQFFEANLPFSSHPIFATAKLHTLDGVLLRVDEPNYPLFYNLWHNQILLALDILILCIFLYFLLKNKINEYFSLHGALKKAIKNRQFYPVYQPLFDTTKNTYSGVEVLLRWQDKHNKIIMPDLFIEEAEDTGLIVPITLQIIETAFKQTKDILYASPQFYLSFNICAFHFTDEKFFYQFYNLRTLYSIAPQQILFEITERDLLDVNNEIFIKKMQELRAAGYSLAVDDYGTGHSSIRYLQYFPFNYLKIDKLFIHAIGTKAITETLNDAIINLAKSINLTIIAEGVETREQVNYLMENEVRFLQGWFFSKALSIEELINLLQGEKK